MCVIKKFSKICICILITIIVFFNIDVYAKNNVSNIDEIVALYDDGTAHITAMWEGTFNEGTEVYIPINTKDIVVRDLTVSQKKDEKEIAYANISQWNVNNTFEEKRYRSSIRKVDDNNVELCFGISEYGRNTYQISYYIENFVKKYEDIPGFNFMLINRAMSTFPTNVHIDIRYFDDKVKLNIENSIIYTFGFVGNAEFKNGKANVETYKALQGEESVIVAMAFDNELFGKAKMTAGSFSDVLDTAKQGSDYYEEERHYIDLFTIIICFIFLIVLMCIIYSIRRYYSLKQFYKDCNYYRDIPNDSNLYLSYALLLDFYYKGIEKTNIVSAILMKLEKNKNIETIVHTDIGFFGKEKRTTEIKLLSEPTDNIDKKLYEMIKYASGEDNILQEKELNTYVQKHTEEYNNILDEAVNVGRNELKKKDGYIKACSKNLNGLTEIGKKEVSNCLGLKKYLNDYSLISEREIREVEIWQDYLIFALLCGDAKKVLKDIKKIYPSYADTIDKYETRVDNTIFISHSICNAMMFSNVNSMRSRGFGGHSSYFGGGGYSGGGYGGGTR